MLAWLTFIYSSSGGPGTQVEKLWLSGCFQPVLNITFVGQKMESLVKLNDVFSVKIYIMQRVLSLEIY
jgi:hypothetical protein